MHRQLNANRSTLHALRFHKRETRISHLAKALPATSRHPHPALAIRAPHRARLYSNRLEQGQTPNHQAQATHLPTPVLERADVRVPPSPAKNSRSSRTLNLARQKAANEQPGVRATAAQAHQAVHSSNSDHGQEPQPDHQLLGNSRHQHVE